VSSEYMADNGKEKLVSWFLGFPGKSFEFVILGLSRRLPAFPMPIYIGRTDRVGRG